MPNWCYNFATINCPSREVYEKFLDSIVLNTWFETFAPLGLDSEKPEGGWDCDKAIEVWKTKWAARDVEILNQYDDDLLLEIRFETAWTPPTGVYSIMNKEHDIEVTAFYNEVGCDFFGRCVYSKEKEIDEFFNHPSNKKELEELRKTISNELDDYMSFTWEELEERWKEEGQENGENQEFEKNEIERWEW
uniref:YubB ferredoxin-like domain-containing protein n=1 Tax=viral metagenome TaxID=1070528 RepID=A0A6C0D8B0_9ZZZZ